MLLGVYLAQAIAGHAGLHALLPAGSPGQGHCHLHAALAEQQVVEHDVTDQGQRRIVSCFHAPGDQSPCTHQHHCAHEHKLKPLGSTDVAGATVPVAQHSHEHQRHEHQQHDDHHHHDGESCQICHHLAQGAVLFDFAHELSLTELLLPVSAPQERFYHAVVVCLPLTRGPPIHSA